MRIPLHDISEIEFNFLFIGAKILMIIDDGVFGAEVILAEKL